MKEPIPFGWAGIDVGKGHHWLCLIDEAGTTIWSTKTEPRWVVGFEVILGAYRSSLSMAATGSVSLVS